MYYRKLLALHKSGDVYWLEYMYTELYVRIQPHTNTLLMLDEDSFT